MDAKERAHECFKDCCHVPVGTCRVCIAAALESARAEAIEEAISLACHIIDGIGGAAHKAGRDTCDLHQALHMIRELAKG